MRKGLIISLAIGAAAIAAVAGCVIQCIRELEQLNFDDFGDLSND